MAWKLSAYFLKQFSYPCRFSALGSRFRRPVPELSMRSNAISYQVYNNFKVPVLLQEHSRKIHEEGAPLKNTFVYIDGTVRPIGRPGVNQRILYNGHKRVHSITFQSVVIPNGLISNLHGSSLQEKCINLYYYQIRVKATICQTDSIMTLNCELCQRVFSVLSSSFIIKLPKICFLCTYVDQMIIQQRLNVLL